MDSLIKKGLEKGLISFNEDKTRISYKQCTKSCNYKDPEEQVRAEIYLQLVFEYGYLPKRIQLEYVVPRRTPSDFADIVVFDDDLCKKPFIVVECKKQSVTEAEFIQAIEQGFGNANSLSASYLWVTTELKSKYYNVKEFPPMERNLNIIAAIPRFGQKDLSKAKFYKGAVDENGNKAFDLSVVEQNDLTKIFSQAHQALWAGGKRNPSEAFDELDKIIFCKIWDERKYRKKGEPYDFQEFTGEDPQYLLNRVKEIYQKGQEKDPEVFREPVRLSANELKTIVSYLSPVNLTGTDLDSKGRAFETFMGSFFRGEFGQYFTPRVVVDFIVKVLPIKNDSLVLDTSCGSGGFLLYALDKIRKRADKMTEEGYFEYGSNQHKEYWHGFAQNNLFGIEISESIARTAKMNMIIHDDGHTNVVSCDGLLSAEFLETKENESKDEIEDRENHNKNTIQGVTKNHKFQYNHFDFILTNPPFGSLVKQSEQAYMKNYGLSFADLNWIDAKIKNKHLSSPRTTQNSEVLFIEQCYNFLKSNGYLAIVVPDGILTNSSMQYIRDWIEEHYRIIAVISLPQTAFVATGAGVKSSILFLKKLTLVQTEKIKEIKIQIQDQLWEETKHKAEIFAVEAEKNKKIKEYEGLNEYLDVPITISLLNKKQLKELEKTEEYRSWKTDLVAEYKEKIEEIKEVLQDEFNKKYSNAFGNYKIFMALAENIGYDASGKENSRLISSKEFEENETLKLEEIRQHDLFTRKIIKRKNEEDKWIIESEISLEDTGISGELTRFIKHIETDTESFFV
jgi:type I restriction enzyme M protein